MPETPTPAALMHEAARRERRLWNLKWNPEKGECLFFRDGVTVAAKIFVSRIEANEAFLDISEEAGMRAALRALAGQFNDPVIKNAIEYAAKEGEEKP